MYSFNTTISSTSATSYIDASTAETIISFYGTAQEKTTWTALSADVKESLLIRSTSIIDNSISFIGGKAEPAQSLDWPRTNVPIEGVNANCTYQLIMLATNVIPKEIEIATALTAVELVNTNRETLKPYTAVKSASLGDLSVDFRDVNQALPDMYQVSNRVYEYLKKYGYLNSNLNQRASSIKVYRGVR